VREQAAQDVICARSAGIRLQARCAAGRCMHRGELRAPATEPGVSGRRTGVALEAHTFTCLYHSLSIAPQRCQSARGVPPRSGGTPHGTRLQRAQIPRDRIAGRRSAGARLSRRSSRCAAQARPWPAPASWRRRRPCAAGGAGRASARPAARRSGPPPAPPARPRCRGWPPRRAAGRWGPSAPRLRAGAARSGTDPGRGRPTSTGGTSLIFTCREAVFAFHKQQDTQPLQDRIFIGAAGRDVLTARRCTLAGAARRPAVRPAPHGARRAGSPGSMRTASTSTPRRCRPSMKSFFSTGRNRCARGGPRRQPCAPAAGA